MGILNGDTRGLARRVTFNSVVRWMSALLLVCAAGLAAGQDGPVTEPVRFDSQLGDVTLAGDLTLPQGQGPFPALVLVDGSGKTTRENMRDFVVALAQIGYATLAYDKRGVGESGGDRDAWRYFSFEKLSADAAAGVEFLTRQEAVDPERIGLLGISQGGWVVPLAATKTVDVAFMVLISPSVTTVAEDRLYERAARLRHEGFSEAEIEEVREMQLADQALTRTGEGFEAFRELWQANRDKRWFRRVYLDDEPAGPDSRWRRWYRRVLDFDPVPILEQLSIPALWLFGDPEHDRLGPVAKSLKNLERLEASGKDYTIHSFPGTNHNIMPVEGEPENGLPPYAEPMINWLGKVNAKDE